MLLADGEEVGRAPLAAADEANRYRGALRPPGPGAYEVLVTAFDPATGNAGLDRTSFILAGPP